MLHSRSTVNERPNIVILSLHHVLQFNGYNEKVFISSLVDALCF